MNYTKVEIKPRQITEDTEIGYDVNGCPIKADRLQKWAYRQLDSSPDMYEALKGLQQIHKVFNQMLSERKTDSEIIDFLDGAMDTEFAHTENILLKAEGK